jgi:hypothetical protein
MRTYLKKKSSQKRAGGVAQGVGPEFKPQYSKKEKRKKILKTEEIMPRMEKGEYLRVDKTEDLPYTSIFLK